MMNTDGSGFVHLVEIIVEQCIYGEWSGIQGNGTFKYSSNMIHPLTKNNSGGIRLAL